MEDDEECPVRKGQPQSSPGWAWEFLRLRCNGTPNAAESTEGATETSERKLVEK